MSAVFRQTPWEGDKNCPVGHWQVPLTQVWPPVQLFPHPPQLVESVRVSTQASPQRIWPLGQAVTHRPALHA